MGASLDIEEGMVKYGVLAALVDWTQDMLSNRTLTVSNGDSIWAKIELGIARRLLSSLLWYLIMDELWTKL